MYICDSLWEKGALHAKIEIEIQAPEVSHRKNSFFLLFFFCCRISLSDPYSKSTPNFKCRNNLKDTKRAVERQATFYSLSFSKYNKRGMGGVSNKQIKKTAQLLRILHAIYSLPLVESLPLHGVQQPRIPTRQAVRRS